MAEEERSFKHLPLSGPGFIRVLYIEPLTEGAEEDSGIVCYIKEVALSDVSEIKYSALSYRWGNPSKKLPIRLSNLNITGPASDPSLFWVTENLNDALLQLRRNHYRLPGDDRNALWIDAICSYVDQY